VDIVAELGSMHGFGIERYRVLLSIVLLLREDPHDDPGRGVSLYPYRLPIAEVC
jgi:hypothetical protein